jgi:hypothetical protein
LHHTQVLISSLEGIVHGYRTSVAEDESLLSLSTVRERTPVVASAVRGACSFDLPISSVNGHPPAAPAPAAAAAAAAAAGVRLVSAAQYLSVAVAWR